MTQHSSVAIASAQDEAELDTFLALHNHSSLYLRCELRRALLRPSFAIAREDGRIVAAAAQSLSGMILLQAPVYAGAVTRAALKKSVRRLAGFYGPLEQVRAARRALGLDAILALKDTAEDLFALKLAQLRLPGALADGALRCRVAAAADAPQLTEWRYAFRVATLNDQPGEQLVKTSRADIAALLASGSLFILDAHEPLACCSFNARLPEIVQIGNVWTPPALRGHGYGRAVVAGGAGNRACGRRHRSDPGDEASKHRSASRVPGHRF